MQSRGHVLAFGEFLIDLIASGNATSLLDVETMVVRPGGAPANVAAALARQGIDAGLCAVVGDDPFGDRLLAVLDANNVDRSRVRQDPAWDTTLALAWKDARGDGHFRLLRQADVQLDIDDVEAAGIGDLEAIVVGSVSLSRQPARGAIDRAVELALVSNVPVCFDVNMRPTIWPDSIVARSACEPVLAAATLLKLSLDDARFVLDLGTDATAEDALAAISAYGNRFVVLTDGARGAWFTTSPDERIHVPAFAIAAKEPTGAGDAFMAATIARLIGNGWATLTADDVRYASAAGALTTTREGAIDSLPTGAEIQEFLDAHRD